VTDSQATIAAREASAPLTGRIADIDAPHGRVKVSQPYYALTPGNVSAAWVLQMIGDIFNFRQAGPNLATSGQPNESQLADIAAAGYEVVINLALHDDPRYSLSDERASVRSLGLEYVHIPVQFDKPARLDLLAFFDAMEHRRSRRVWVHCAANMRVTAFVSLFRVLREGWATDHAFALMHEIWQPNEIWARFIATELAGAVGPPAQAAKDSSRARK
jgi:protein tyrosine phosphatase (PTP) superfamily phosphohydrolase (DUF442 family)